MKISALLLLASALVAVAAPVAKPHDMAARDDTEDIDEYVRYPDFDRDDEDVVYVYPDIGDHQH